MHLSVQNGIKAALRLIAQNRLMSESDISKSRQYIPMMGKWSRGSHGGLDSIHSPFLQLGCSENDVDQLRRHREVRVGMSMPNRSKSWRYRTLAVPLTYNGRSVASWAASPFRCQRD